MAPWWIPQNYIFMPGCESARNMAKSSQELTSLLLLGNGTPKSSTTSLMEKSKAQMRINSVTKEEYYRGESRKTGIELLPGVLNLLKSLNESGARQAIGSSAPKGNLELILELTGIGKYMQAMVAMEDTQRGKPDPQVFLMGAEKLKIQPFRSVVVEDAIAGVQAAKAGGMKCVAVTFVGHHSAEKLKEAGADRVVKTLEDMSAGDFYKLAEG